MSEGKESHYLVGKVRHTRNEDRGRKLELVNHEDNFLSSEYHNHDKAMRRWNYRRFRNRQLEMGRALDFIDMGERNIYKVDELKSMR